MNSKKIVWIGMIIGSAVGSYIPLIWGGSLFSFSSIIFTALGGIVGIYFGFKINQY